MRRRLFLCSLAGGLVTAPLAVTAQQANRVWRVGFLQFAASNLIDEFRQGLRDLGYVEGRNLLVEQRMADGKADWLPGVAADLVRLRPDVIVAATSPAARAAHEATRTIPLFFVNVGDPLGLGLAASLARPGGNATGTASYGPELAQKVLEVAKDLTPQTRHMALVWNPGNPLHAITLKNLEGPARRLGIKLQPLSAATPEELEPAFHAAAAGRADVVWVFGDQVFFAERTRIAGYALSERLPTMFLLRQHVEAGGLASYGADAATMYRRAAVLVDKILKGAKPADLPIEQPTKFELAINLKTAKALGLTIPQSLILRADHVIE